MHTFMLCVNAFVIGFLGSGHCVGMCGGINSALMISVPNSKQSMARLIRYGMMLSLGRMISYAMVGCVAGVLGFSIVALLGHNSMVIMHYISGIILISLGLYIGQIWYGLQWVEKKGILFWKQISKYTTHFMPVDSLLKSFGLGLLWGAIPCGLVYSALTWALSIASWYQSALLMLCFGLGTLPAMITISSCAHRCHHILKALWFRRVSALIIVGYGIWVIVTAYSHHHHIS